MSKTTRALDHTYRELSVALMFFIGSNMVFWVFDVICIDTYKISKFFLHFMLSLFGLNIIVNMECSHKIVIQPHSKVHLTDKPILIIPYDLLFKCMPFMNGIFEAWTNKFWSLVLYLRSLKITKEFSFLPKKITEARGFQKKSKNVFSYRVLIYRQMLWSVQYLCQRWQIIANQKRDED